MNSLGISVRRMRVGYGGDHDQAKNLKGFRILDQTDIGGIAQDTLQAG